MLSTAINSSEERNEDAISCIFFAEFHSTAGPQIACQIPNNYMSKEAFDNVSNYIIPNKQIQRTVLSVTLEDFTILNYPVRLTGPQYARNAFHFDCCFVFHAGAQTEQYEPIIKKFSEFLIVLEEDKSFLTTALKEPTRLVEMLTQVIEDLKTQKTCILEEGQMMLHLKLVKFTPEPDPVLDHQVPIFLEDVENFDEEQWDLTTKRVVQYINGFNYVSRIAVEADIDIETVKICIENLVFFKLVALIPIFQYSNVYATTPKLKILADDKDLQERCILYSSISSQKPALLKNIFSMYANMTHATNIKDLCMRMNPQSLGIDERRLIQFGLVEGLIRRIEKYPISTSKLNSNGENNSVEKYFTGSYSLDEICCKTGKSAAQIEDIVERDQNLTMLCK